MMMSHRMNSPAALRFADRRRREQDAPRLLREVPKLKELKLEIEERTGLGGTKHVRRVLIDRAPALFLVPCGDPRCLDGEHDLTAVVMRALDAGKTAFEGTDECRGSLGSAACTRVLHFRAQAEYSAEAASPPPAG
jgi:hypothetical protein